MVFCITFKKGWFPFRYYVVAGAEGAKAATGILPELCGTRILGNVLLYIKSQVLRRVRGSVLVYSPKFSSLMLLNAIWDLGF